MNMATLSATTTTSSLAPAILSHKPSPRLASPVSIGLKKRKVMCSMQQKVDFVAEENGSRTIGMSGTGLPFGLSNNLLGWILFGVFGLIWALYFVYTAALEEDEESGLSL
ncbi:hypothetical protein V6N11_006648 [Hibiscus sabdariffa]|uniref:PSII 6.1 kDa protein n=1 Tax=Hibiscus sabdariffa TaxID=183260 RepID=A0ABR2RRU9_9ROSI